MGDQRQPPGYYVDAFGLRGPRPTFYAHPMDFQQHGMVAMTPPLPYFGVQRTSLAGVGAGAGVGVSPPFGSPPLQGRGVTRPYSLFTSEPQALPQEKLFQQPVSPNSVFADADRVIGFAPQVVVTPPPNAQEEKKVRQKLHLLPRSNKKVSSEHTRQTSTRRLQIY